ncbi:pre-mRNA-splicing factor CWC25 homolog [Bactrocera neohumeralis]|uniref:pre-mRNA-splicing factor CWC25 homolog n=1 Tax=Bactrocera neohumeralis TaxID=98809 RepID=UPI0021651676|nr:pre-mRNA-splicing factor CWC25 homolog [Bactrocera neohumeralis]
MGGGDLNLKKSWHPHTMKNQEKVWKAEQAKSEEDKKLKDLRREIDEEKTREELKQIGRNSGILPQEDKKLEWMYKSSNELINREEYLLGRNIDKSFEMLQAEEQRKDQNMVGVKQSINHVEHECIPFSIRSYRNMENTEQVDLQRKVMEDPLMLIKQREMESRKKLLENPVKLKELHRILKTDELLKKSKKVKKSKKSKKSKKKHKKRSKYSSDDNSSDSESGSDTAKDLDKELAKRYKKLNKEEDFSGLNLSKLLDAKFETITKELDKAAGSKRKKDHRHRSNNSDSGHESKRRSRSRDRDRIIEKKSYESKEREKACRSPRHRSPSNYQKKQSSITRSPDEPRKRQYSTSPSVERDVRNISHSKRSRSSRSLSKDRKKINDHRARRHDYKDREMQLKRRPRSTSPKIDKSRRRSEIRSPVRSSNRERSISQRIRSRSPQRSSRSSRRASRSPRRNSPFRRNSRSPRRSSRSPRRNLPYRKNSRSPRRRERSKDHNENKEVHARSKESRGIATQKKLSNEEKEARLREMMENASWREEDRVKAVQKHREANAREEQQYKNQDFDKEFINKEVKKAIATQSSIGSRIRSNLNNIQRTSAAMNSNFTKK